MTEAIEIFRLMLIPGGIAIFLVVVALTNPPKNTLHLVLGLCWTAGLLNFLVDVLQKYFGFWHYTLNNLILGYPFDLYIAVSLVIGGAVPLIYWRLKSSHPQGAPLFIVILPFYLLLQDYAVQKLTKGSVFVGDSPYWVLYDFLAIEIIVLGTIFILNYRKSR